VDFTVSYFVLPDFGNFECKRCGNIRKAHSCTNGDHLDRLLDKSASTKRMSRTDCPSVTQTNTIRVPQMGLKYQDSRSESITGVT
jgi:hypothetical protein